MRCTVFAWLCVVLLAACARQAGPASHARVGVTCNANDLPGCERGLADAARTGGKITPWVKPYLTARESARGESDGWVSLWREIQGAARAGAWLVVIAPPGDDALRRDVTSTLKKGASAEAAPTFFDAPELPALDGMSQELLVLAMARGAGVEHVAWVRSKQVVHAVGRDGLAPVTFHVPALYMEKAGTHVGRSIAEAALLDHGVNAATASLAQSHYRAAAATASRLASMLQHIPVERGIGLRARFLVSRAYLFGGSSKVEDGDESDTDAEKPDPGAVSAAEQGAYAAWIRVLLAKESKEAWKTKRKVVQHALSPDRTAALDSLYNHDPKGKVRCELERRPPPPAALRGDPLFANRLAWLAQQRILEPADWARAYELMVARTERTRTTWYAISGLLSERGELPGLSTRGSDVYRRVTRLALTHIAALAQFQRKTPKAYHSSGQLSFGVMPGTLRDPEVASAVQQLLADNVKYKLTTAKDPGELLETTLVLGATAIMFPEPARSGFLQSLQKGVDNQLRTSMSKEGGWSVATLVAASALGSYLTGTPPDFGFAGTRIADALESPKDIKVRPLALLAARGVHYATLVATNDLEPEKVGARVGGRRGDARNRLRRALREMAGPDEKVPEGALQHLTTLVDGAIATSVLVVLSGDEGEEPKDACAEKRSSVWRTPAARRNLRALAAARDALLRDGALAKGDTTWSRRANLLLVVFSDALDIAGAPADTPAKFKVPRARAARSIRAGLEEWTSQEVAEGVAALHTIARALIVSDKEWKDVLLAHRRDLGKVFKGVSSLTEASETSTLGRFALVALSRMAGSDSKMLTGDANASGVLDYANTLYGLNRPDHATIALLLSTALEEHDVAMMRRATTLARRHRSPAAWALGVRHAISSTRPGHPLVAKELERSLREISTDECEAAQVEPLIAASRAIADFSKGQRAQATKALDTQLARMERDGISVPRVQYQFDDILTSGRVLRISVHMSAAQGFISENSMTMGLDVFSTKPTKGLKVEIPQAVNEDAARYFVQVAATNGLYHFLLGDSSRGAWDVERATNGIHQGLRFGDTIVPPNSAWVEDSRDTLRLAAAAALQRSHTLLAGDVLRMLRDGLEPDAEESGPSVGEPHPKESLGIRALQGIDDLRSKSRTLRTVLYQSVSCDPKKKPKALTAVDSCAALREGIALWRAGVYAKPPTMRKGAKETCAQEAALVESIMDLDKAGTKPPAPRVADKITGVVRHAFSSQRPYDALSLIRLAGDANICTPKLAELAQRAGRTRHLTPQARVGWLSYGLKCPAQRADSSFWSDLNRLADAADRLPDLRATNSLHTALVRYMVAQQAWDRLTAFTHREGFVDLMARGGPKGSATVLVLQHAAAILSGKRPDLEKSRDAWEIACIQFGDTGREGLCRGLGVLRNRSAKEPVSNLKTSARKLIHGLLGP